MEAQLILSIILAPVALHGKPLASPSGVWGGCGWSGRWFPLVLAICRHPQHLPAAAHRACRGLVVSSQLEGGGKEEEEGDEGEVEREKDEEEEREEEVKKEEEGKEQEEEEN